jgi:hypothetical protein
MASVAEDIRKVAHVTKMIGINQSKWEEKNNILRLNVLAQREGERQLDQIIVLTKMEVCRVYTDARLLSDLPSYQGIEEKKVKKGFNSGGF